MAMMALLFATVFGAVGLLNALTAANRQALITETSSRTLSNDKEITKTYLKTMRKIGGGFTLSSIAGSVTTPAANVCYVKRISQIGAFITTLLSGENTKVAINRYQVDMDYYHADKPFQVIHAVVFGSPSCTNTDGASTSSAPHLVIEEAIADGKWGAIYGPLIRSRRIVDNGAQRYIATASMDLTKIAKQVAQLFSEREMTEESALKVWLYSIVFSDISGTAVSYEVLVHNIYNIVQRGFGF